MYNETELTEIELKILLASRINTKQEVAQQFNLTEEEVSSHLTKASRKISMSSVPTSIDYKDFLPRPLAFRLEKKVGEQQLGTMKVGSKILEMLSKGIYTAPWNSLKELISNSFDADAQKVEISYEPNSNKLLIKDDGIGMDYMDFDEHFTFIVRSEKRKYGLYTSIFKRPIIGKIGIGFIAVSELCEKVKIKSSKKGVDTFFVADIDFSKITSEAAKDKEFYEVSQYTLTNFHKENLEEHYTEIELLNLKESFIDILNNKSPQNITFGQFHYKSFEDVIKYIGNGTIQDIKTTAGTFWEFLYNLANTIPSIYLDEGPIDFNKIILSEKYIKKYEDISQDDSNFNQTKRIINNIKNTLENYNFKVYFNDLELKKPIKLPNQSEVQELGLEINIIPFDKEIKAKDDVAESNSIIKCRGYFYYQKTRIVPQIFRGLLIRIKNVAIGDPSLDFWGHPFSGDNTYFPQTYGEIYVESGLEEAMNIDRSKFKTTHFEFTALRDELHQFLRSNVFSLAKQMYSKRRSDKSEIKNEARIEVRSKTVKEELGQNFIVQETRKFNPIAVEINENRETIVLNTIADPFEGFKKDDRLLLQDVALALEIAFKKETGIGKIKDEFWRVLRELTRERHH